MNVPRDILESDQAKLTAYIAALQRAPIPNVAKETLGAAHAVIAGLVQRVLELERQLQHQRRK